MKVVQDHVYSSLQSGEGQRVTLEPRIGEQDHVVPLSPSGAPIASSTPAMDEHSRALDMSPWSLDFVLPGELEAAEPSEARGLARDEVRLMVSHYRDDRIEHSTFRDLPSFLEAGDLMVVNTSGTLNAAVRAWRSDARPFVLHLSTRLPAGLWLVEPRRLDEATGATHPLSDITPGETTSLSGGGEATLLTPYGSHDDTTARMGQGRLWVATLRLPCTVVAYLSRYGTPIRYSYVTKDWPSSYYQTVYAMEPGSAEMPSAGRAFTPEILIMLMARGVAIAPMVLHTGVSSLEGHEPPYEERYRMPEATVRAVNSAHAAGRRVVAVGTTVVRGIETTTDAEGVVHPGEGWTDLVITPRRGLRAVDALLTGFHEPRSSHLAMLEALTGHDHLVKTYDAALREHYLWHEFGDLHLILP